MLQNMTKEFLAHLSAQTDKFGLGEVGMTALEALLDEDPENVKENVKLAFRYEDEVRSVMESRMERVNLKRNLRIVEAKQKDLENRSTELQIQLSEVAKSQIESEKLLENFDKSENMQTGIGDAIRRDLKETAESLTLIKNDIEATDKALVVAKSDVEDVEKALSSTDNLSETTR